MFSNLCRVCLTEFQNESDSVPLFEPYRNIWYHRLINKTFRLSLSKDDNLATNVCKNCAIEILRSYKFRLKYIESDRKLRQMLEDHSEAEPNLLDVVVTIDEGENVLPFSPAKSPSAPIDSRWKCNLCSSTFKSRTQYRDHRRWHRNNGDHLAAKANQQKYWKCDKCTAEFPTKHQRLKHKRERHSAVAMVTPSILVHDGESDHNHLDLPNLTEVDVDTDQNEIKFFDPEPEMDLGLYLIEKNSQIGSFDPLEANNSLGDSRLIPSKVDQPSTVAYTENINRKWKCRLCAETFRTRDLLSEHNRVHMAMKSRSKAALMPLKVKSVKTAQNACDKKAVVERKPKVAKWKCQTCLSLFETRDLLREHRRAYAIKSEATGAKIQSCKMLKQIA